MIQKILHFEAAVYAKLPASESHNCLTRCREASQHLHSKQQLQRQKPKLKHSIINKLPAVEDSASSTKIHVQKETTCSKTLATTMIYPHPIISVQVHR